ncbi:MAG: hypothetical protein Q8O67_31985 [Deltaproteobacteria bacterium]|nr:hypothetical protein [Deltaproteobacteria bacterium]
MDTLLVFALPNPSADSIEGIRAVLSADSDPTVVIVSSVDRLGPGQTGQVVVRVRPLVVGTLTATLLIDCDAAATPNHVEVPITVTAVNTGLPDIVVDPAALSFVAAGTARIIVTNAGIRDLVIDSITLAADTDPAFSIVSGSTTAPLGALNPSMTITIAFAPAAVDAVPRFGTLVVRSNDPDEPELLVPLIGRAVGCPIAVATLETLDVLPFSSLRLDGRESHADTPGIFIVPPPEGFAWTLLSRPVGSASSLTGANNDRAALHVDLPGLYQAQLEVFALDAALPDAGLIRSCVPAILDIIVEPVDELAVVLTWDHADADLDIHVVNDGGAPFTDTGDVYFGHRTPTPGTAAWSANPDENPRLDIDDDRGFGPENSNIKRPAPGSRWSLLVHYWNKQTSGDPTTTATLQVLVHGEVAAVLHHTFERDQQLWDAADVVWTEPPSILPIDASSPFLRPF